VALLLAKTLNVASVVFFALPVLEQEQSLATVEIAVI
jgi:hypothetical protein